MENGKKTIKIKQPDRNWVAIATYNAIDLYANKLKQNLLINPFMSSIHQTVVPLLLMTIVIIKNSDTSYNNSIRTVS